MSKRPTSTKQPSSQSHRRRSSGDLTKKQLDEFTVLLDDIESRVIELRDNPKWGDLEEVQQLAQEIQTLSTRVNRFKKIKTEDPEAVIVSLSNMDFNLLKDRLGVKDPVLVAAGHSPQDFLAGVQTALQGYDLGPCDFPDIVEIVTAWDCSFLFNLLKTYAKNINNSTEAAARIIIDPWIIGSLQLVEAIKSNASAKYRTVLLPELLVWSAQSGNQKDGPAIIKYKENITHLAGSIDYVTVNYHLPYLNLQEPGDIGQFAYRHRDINKIVNGDNFARTIRLFNSADTFTLCEAKRYSKKLNQHEPQVVAECLALSNKFKTVPGYEETVATEKVGFTLTTGEAWVFGLVDTKKRRYFKTTEITIDLKTLGTLENASESLRALMILMLIWGTQSSDVLETIMTSPAFSVVQP